VKDLKPVYWDEAQYKLMMTYLHIILPDGTWYTAYYTLAFNIPHYHIIRYKDPKLGLEHLYHTNSLPTDLSASRPVGLV